jgi:hypothetical protein
MKKFFTLCVLVFTTIFSKAQINENFDNGFAVLEANCWEFPSMQYASAPAGYVIHGNGSPYSEPPVNSSSVRIMHTPFIYIYYTIDISFVYKLSENLNGQSSRYVTLELINPSGAVVQTLTNFDVPGNATSNSVFDQTFAVNVPGPYRLSITIGGSNGQGHSRLSIDDLQVDAELLGCDANATPLPIHLISFQGNMNKNNKVTLNWTVADNETANNFEVERSTNGRDFTTVGVVFSSEKMGTENYMFYETYTASEKVMYRLKMIDKNKEINYSKILVFGTKTIVTNDIKIIGNPVNDKLTFSYTSSKTQQVSVKVYDISGKTVLNNKINSLDGNNLVSLPLGSTFTKGMYVVEVNDGIEIKTAKFVKQ